jgi:hypothetical protein
MIQKVIAKSAERHEGSAGIAGVQDGSEIRNSFTPGCGSGGAELFMTRLLCAYLLVMNWTPDLEFGLVLQ